MRKRKQNIPQILKDFVRQRENGNCSLCLRRPDHFHHIVAYSIDKTIIHAHNIVLLCEEHHKLFHLGDPDTFQAVYEYAWFLQYGSMPEEKDLLEISTIVSENLKALESPF